MGQTLKAIRVTAQETARTYFNSAEKKAGDPLQAIKLSLGQGVDFSILRPNGATGKTNFIDHGIIENLKAGDTVVFIDGMGRASGITINATRLTLHERVDLST